ncbi:ABC transporter permease [Planctomycetota bacterium]|nr:ABC transporter permease [Planctomycetota bacterium]
MVEEVSNDGAPKRKPSFNDMKLDESGFASEYSKDYWDLVFEQLGKRTLFKVGVAILTLLYGVAIFAPVIANDRPFKVESVDLKSYGSALRILRPMATTANRLAQQSDADFAASLADAAAGAPTTRAAAARVEFEAATLRLATMRSMLPDDAAEPLAAFQEHFSKGADLLDAGDIEGAAAEFGEAKTVARALRKDLKALDPAKPDAGGVPLISRTERPLLESIAAWEVVLMVLWLLWASWPLWNRLWNGLLLGGDRERIRRARRLKLAACFGLAILSSALWRSTFGPTAEFDFATHKQGITDGSVVLLAKGKTTADLAADPEAAQGALVWPMVPFGYDELHADEKFRPPTWTEGSARDPETGLPLDLVGEELAGGLAPAEVAIQVRVGEPELNAASRHPLGTDESGRDVLSRMIWGGRVSLSVGILSAALLTIIGVIIGSIAGYFGGWVDIGIMRGIEILQSIPAFFLILLALAFTDPETVPPMFAIVLVIAIVRWTGVARLVRGEFLRLREQEFVVASQALGFSSRRTIFKHVLPNAMSPVLVAAAFSVAAGILTESAVSFLGFGIREPDASWGAIVNESRNPENWWIQMFPGVAIFVTVTCYNLVGDAIRDAMDPKMKV